MKVKVSYTVDFDDVPELAEELLASARRELTDCVSKLKFRPNNLAKMMGDYQVVREKMDIVGDQVHDVLNITAGWANAAHAAPEEVEEDDDRE